MGQNGSLTFYTTRPPDNPKATLRALVLHAHPEHVLSSLRSIGEDREWEDLLNDGPGVRHELLPPPPSVDEFVNYYREGTSLGTECVGSPLALRIKEAVAAAIPVSVRGDYVPTDLGVRIGFHDIVDDAEHEEGLLIARPFLSIGFFGYSTPNDWKAFREAVFQIPEVQAVKRDLETITGPLEQCIIWSV
jgi:hypothetical protein